MVSKSQTSPSSSCASRCLCVLLLAPSSLRYTVEEMKNVGSMTLRCWDERFETSSAPASLATEAWSTTYVNSTSMRLHTGWPQTSSYLRLPAAASLSTSPNSSDRSQKSVDAVFKSDHFEIRLPTQEGQSSTRTREDLDLTFPYPASAFRTYRPDSLVCASAKCTGRAVLADLKDVDRYNDLPSEYWAELLDAWMCHQDQTLSEELIQKGNNIWPKDRQGLISSSGILVTASNARGWHIAEGTEVSHGLSRVVTSQGLQCPYGLIRRPALAYAKLQGTESSPRSSQQAPWRCI